MPKKKAKKNDDDFTITEDPKLSRDANLANIVLKPTVQASATTKHFNLFDNESAKFGALVDEFGEQVKAVQNGDLSRPEAMLISQAHTLDAIFNSLARRAAVNMGEYIGAAETYMRLALKAQSQCRTTLEALSEIKNPRHVAFVKQANIAHNQQVNNGSRAQENEIKQSKLLEKTDGERLDTGATSAASGADPHMETVGASHRAEND